VLTELLRRVAEHQGLQAGVHPGFSRISVDSTAQKGGKKHL
jgi:hypothetical protein